MTRVFINGIDSLLGAGLAQQLSANPDVSIIGLGRKTPPAPIGHAEFLIAHLTGRQLRELLRTEGVEVVVQLAFAGAESPAASREEAIQQNILGSMELLGACVGTGVRRVLVRSHTAVYGASPLNPTFISEGRPLARINAPGVVRDFAEVEQFLAEFAAQHRDLAIIPLRLAPLIGGWSPFVDYLAQSEPRILLGFDPTIQLLHLSDAVAAFALATLSDACGAFNFASEDTLCLSQIIKLAGRRPAPVFEPVVNLALATGSRDVLGLWPFDISFLRHSCVVDTARARCELGWAPTYTALEMLQQLSPTDRAAESRETAEEALRAFLARRS